MKKILSTLLMIAFSSTTIFSQTSKDNLYAKAMNAPIMRWTCPDIEKYQGLLYSLRDGDEKVYANNVMEQIKLYADPSSPSNKYMITQTVFNIENPLYKTENLFAHISDWMKRQGGWGKKMIMDIDNKEIMSVNEVQVGQYSSFVSNFKAYISPNLVIKLIEEDKLLISFVTKEYKVVERSSDNRSTHTYISEISKVYPFVPKSSRKNTYAAAYVGAYQYVWMFISNLRDELNEKFSKDKEYLATLRYEHSRDSLCAKYGEPTKIINNLSNTLDINNEIYFFEDAQKVVFMGKTINFKDIMSCTIDDDPQFIPGRSTTYGAGISFFGIGLGGKETTRTADKVIHNYVVDIKIDNLKVPFIRIAIGQDEHKATDIASTFEYVIRHKQSNKTYSTQKSRKNSQRMKR